MTKPYEKKRKYPKKEGNFLKSFMEELSILNPDIWHFKTHGEAMQTKGVPDVIMCYNRMFVAIEFKIMRSGNIMVTPYQEYTIDKINKANGITAVIWWDEGSGEVGIGSTRFATTKKLVIHFNTVLKVASSMFNLSTRTA